MGCINDQEKGDFISQVSVPQSDQNQKANTKNSFMDQSISGQRKQLKLETQTNTTFTEKTQKREEAIPFPQLKLQVYNTETHQEIDTILITPNSVAHINSSCLIKPEGIFSFGNSKTDNDFVMNQLTPQQHFSIQYVDKQYYIKDNNSGSGSCGIFSKIESQRVITEEKVIISFANCFLYLHTFEDNKLNITFHQEKEIMYHTLNPNDNQLQCFKVGRGKECDIVIKSNSISRIQCSLKYSNDHWLICDGFEDKPSLNGLWELIRGTIVIKNGSIYKIGNINITIQLCLD